MRAETLVGLNIKLLSDFSENINASTKFSKAPWYEEWVLGALSPGLKRPGREIDHFRPSSAEVKNGGAVSPISHTCSWPRGA
jgi:hypothetical protein